MPNEPNPKKPQPITQGVRKLLRLGHSTAITLPARWLKATAVNGQIYVGYRVTVDGELVFYPGGRGADGH